MSISEDQRYKDKVDLLYKKYYRSRSLSNLRSLPKGGTTGQVLAKDSNSDFDTVWQTVALGGGGDMAASTYDPTSVEADAFDMDNMLEGGTNLILTSSERTKLSNTSGVNTGDQSVAYTTTIGLTDLDDYSYNDLTDKPTIPSSHTELDDIGSNTHAQIDSHISNTSNPHSVDKTDVGLSNVPNTDATSRSNHTGTQTLSTISDAGTGAGINIHVGTTAPGSPSTGDLWVDTN
jgi:hypothetical protein